LAFDPGPANLATTQVEVEQGYIQPKAQLQAHHRPFLTANPVFLRSLERLVQLLKPNHQMQNHHPDSKASRCHPTQLAVVPAT
jgi:hypothetical protein